MNIHEAIKTLKANYPDACYEQLREAVDMAISAFGAIDQYRWERDIAVEQLKELGYELGEKIRTDGDCISRKEAIDELISEPSEMNYGFYYAEKIKALPSVQPERKVGKWINAYPDIEPNPMFMYGICSVCGCEQAISNKLNFCPDCGADMRGELDE